MTMINTIVFDLDGTLLDTLQDLHASVNFALKKHNLPLRSLDEVRCFVGNGVEKLMQRATDNCLDEARFSELFKTFKEHYKAHSLDNTAPYSGIVDMIADLKRRGFKLAIVSNKLDPAVKDLYEYFFRDYVDIALGESEKTRKKPNPDMVVAALEYMHTERQNAVYVGDSDVDIQTAKNSGLTCISVTWGFRDREFLLNNGATILIDKPEELLGIVEKI